MEFRRSYNNNEPPLRKIEHTDDTFWGESIINMIESPKVKKYSLISRVFTFLVNKLIKIKSKP